MTEPHAGPWVESPWKPGTLLTREENGQRYYGQVIPASAFGIATLDGARVQSVATQSDALRYGWEPWIAEPWIAGEGEADGDLIVPARVVSTVAKAALTLRDERTVMERTIQRQLNEVEMVRKELKDFKRTLVREIRESVEHEDEDDQEKAYALLGRLGLDVVQRHTVEVTLSLTVDIAPGQSLDESDVTAAITEAITDDDFDVLRYVTIETEWVVNF